MSEETLVWEETDWEGDVGRDGGGKVIGSGIYAEDGLPASIGFNAARLAAAAPEMARMLVSLVTYGSDSDWECPDCAADLLPPRPCEPDVESQAAVHKADCALVAVLRRAGVLPEVAP